MPIRRSLVFFALVLFGVPFAFFSFAATSPEILPAASSAPGTVNITSNSNLSYHIVGAGNVVSVVSAVGKIEADELLQVSFTTSGRVQEIFVKPGDYVEVGHPLIQLENTDLRIAYDRALLNYELAEIEYAELNGPVDADSILLAQASVDAAWGNYRSTLNTASVADIEAAELRVQQAQTALDAAVERRVFGGNFSNEMEVSLADARVGEASFNLEIARLQSQDIRSGNSAVSNAAYLSYLQALAELDRVLAGPTEIQLEQSQVRIDQARAQLERAELALSKSLLVAPTEGYIGDVLVEAGEVVSATVPVVQLVDTVPLSLTVQIDEIDIGQIEPSMEALVEVDALSELRLNAVLKSIALTGVASSGGIVNYSAEVELVDTDPRIKVGMTAEANIIIDSAENVLVVPNAYVRLDRRQNQAFVNVVTEDNVLVERQVSLGLAGQDYSAVLSGLEAGDIIAANLTGNQFSLFGE